MNVLNCFDSLPYLSLRFCSAGFLIKKSIIGIKIIGQQGSGQGSPQFTRDGTFKTQVFKALFSSIIYTQIKICILKTTANDNLVLFLIRFLSTGENL